MMLFAPHSRCAAPARGWVVWMAGLWMGLLVAGLPALAADSVEQRYLEAARHFHQLKALPATSAAEWQALADSFSTLQNENPAHVRGPDALYSAALAFVEGARHGGGAAQAQRSVELFRLFSTQYPNHPLADDSLVFLGVLYQTELQNPQAALAEYRRVLEHYPNSDQAALARKRAEALEQSSSGAPSAQSAPPTPSAPSALTPPHAARGVKPLVQPAVYTMPLAETPPTQASRGSDQVVPGQGASAVRQGGGEIRQIQILAAKHTTRVILTLDRMVPFRQGEIPADKNGARRVFLDLDDTRLHPKLPAVHSSQGAQLSRVRVGHFNANTSRVVLELGQVETIRVERVNLGRMHRVVIDLDGPGAPALKPTLERVQTPAPTPSAAQEKQGTTQAALDSRPLEAPAPPSKDRPVTLRKALGLKVKTIVIDPGHGGHDPGAVAFGVKEKDLVLVLARRLKQVIQERNPEIEVKLTRDDDRFIPLAERPALAKRMGGDLFISIHLNANRQEKYHGTETYFLNLTNDPTALGVAARENAANAQQVGEFNDILKRLMGQAKLEESNQLAQRLQAGMVGWGKSRNLGVKQAPFMVLLGSEMPSVLVEAGFVTNRKENKLLNTPEYQRKIAEGIYEGLRSYLEY
ncbi:MAG: N-acetylmuramoyl-L-alanine amidase [Deltaproteobacteria bacterium]|nr:N-acetylmuramoyl-L-alanine amidase [Deltaproteobacteria bacterium]